MARAESAASKRRSLRCGFLCSHRSRAGRTQAGPARAGSMDPVNPVLAGQLVCPSRTHLSINMQAPKIIRKGVLRKRGHTSGKWTRRQFQLTMANLTYSRAFPLGRSKRWAGCWHLRDISQVMNGRAHQARPSPHTLHMLRVPLTLVVRGRAGASRGPGWWHVQREIAQKKGAPVYARADHVGSYRMGRSHRRSQTDFFHLRLFRGHGRICPFVTVPSA